MVEWQLLRGEPYRRLDVIKKDKTMATLRELRMQHHLTQEQLAGVAEVSPSTVYHIEAGKVRPRPSIVRRLARALQVEPQAIDLEPATSERHP